MNRPRTAISNRSRAIVVRIPDRSSHHATERESHSAARFAVHGVSSGTLLRPSDRACTCASAIVTTASGLIFGMSPV